MRLLRLSLILSCMFVGAAASATKDAPTENAVSPLDPVLAEAIALVREKALKAERVDWPVVTRQAQDLTLAQSGEAGRTAAIRHVLTALGDGHSSYRPPASGATPAHPSAQAPPSSPAAPSQAAAPRAPIAEAVVAGRFGRIRIHPWVGPLEAVPAATVAVRDALIRALAADTCGLIVDVASNHGGNMWPMMGGIASLYDAGTLLTFENRTGARQVIDVRDGWLRRDRSVYPQAGGLVPLPHTPKHIAVLLGARTASSGEILALGFKGQANVRFFGRSTAGATTANSTLRLSNGGAIALTTAHILDRSGRVHHGPVLPDEQAEDPVAAAETWLGAQCP